MRPLLTMTALVAFLAAPPFISASTFVWCEADLFDDLGGWLHDAQFVDQMGSPYLLAYGLEGPAKDAVTKANVPLAGKYRLWVRTRDWLPEHSPGRFQVLLGGQVVDHVFGQGKAKGWVWEDGGWHTLPAGNIEIRLRDLTGHYGRCDALLLTDDSAYQPPNDLRELNAERIAHGGLSREVTSLGPYDTVVVGGGLAGTFAAVASARMGCKTALLQNRPVLGGNTSSEVLVRPEGDTTREPLDPGEGGIIEEIRASSAEGYSDRMLELCKRQTNLDLYLNTHATGVQLVSGQTSDALPLDSALLMGEGRKGTIAAVTAIETTTRRRLSFSGSIFIDCTGDGSIGYWAGAEWRHGREPRSMYDESRAPETPDGHTMGGTLRYATQLMPEPVVFQAPAWARKFDQCEDFNVGRHPQLNFGGWQWVIEYGGMGNTIIDAEEVRDELLRIIWGMWDHAKNHCAKLAAEAPKYKLTWISYVVGKRESRRIIGDYVMTEHDIAKQVLFPDRVSYAGWGIDIHPPGGFYDTEPPATFSHKLKFSVPFRSLYSKDVDNLMMAGRCISVSHVALGATRVMITCGLQGQAAGTAAGVCKQHKTSPRGVGQSYIAEVQQQLLKDGCYLIDLPNEDPRDLARRATATASSQSPPVRLEMPVSHRHALTSDRAVLFKVEQGPIQTVSLYLHSENRRPTPVELTLRPAAKLGDFDSEQDLAKAPSSVPPRSEGWVTFQLDAQVAPGYYYVWLPKTPGVSWALFEERLPDAGRAWRPAKGQWNPSGEAYKFKINAKPPAAAAGTIAEEPQPPADMFAPANAINGFARAIRAVPNSWRPDPKAPLPQWLLLDFGRPVTFNRLHVSFQSKEMRATEFRFEVPDGSGWRPIAEVRENSDRRRVLSFAEVTADKVRLVILAARAQMGVCEIRVYRDPDGTEKDVAYGRRVD